MRDYIDPWIYFDFVADVEMLDQVLFTYMQAQTDRCNKIKCGKQIDLSHLLIHITV